MGLKETYTLEFVLISNVLSNEPRRLYRLLHLAQHRLLERRAEVAAAVRTHVPVAGRTEQVVVPAR